MLTSWRHVRTGSACPSTPAAAASIRVCTCLCTPARCPAPGVPAPALQHRACVCGSSRLCMRLQPAQSRHEHKHTQCPVSGCRHHVGRQASIACTRGLQSWRCRGPTWRIWARPHLVKLVPLPVKLCQLKADTGSLAARTGCHGFCGCCWRPSTASCCTAVCHSECGSLALCSCARGRVPVKHRLSSSAQLVRLPHVLEQHALQLQGLALCSYKAIRVARLLTQLGQQQPPAVHKA